MLVAAHQPNLLPRLHTVAKILSADILVILDDVQFSQREWQNRARLTPYRAESTAWFWLTLPVALPQGRATRIDDVRIVDSEHSLANAVETLTQSFSSSPYWSDLEPFALSAFRLEDDRLATIAATSLCAAARALGWTGRVELASTLGCATDRVGRLVDATLLCGGNRYVSGRGGRRYLTSTPFAERGVVPLVAEVDHDDLGLGLPENLSWISYAARFGRHELSERLRRVVQLRQLAPQ